MDGGLWREVIVLGHGLLPFDCSPHLGMDSSKTQGATHSRFAMNLRLAIFEHKAAQGMLKTGNFPASPFGWIQGALG